MKKHHYFSAVLNSIHLLTMSTLLITFFITTLFFVAEAIIHYNIGKTGEITMRRIPSRREMVKIVLVVMLFAFFSVTVSEMISRMFGVQVSV